MWGYFRGGATGWSRRLAQRGSTPEIETAASPKASRPIFKSSDFIETAGIPRPTAARILRIVRDAALISEIRSASGRRAAVLAFPELLNIAEGHGAF
jgi:hypothetical protein